MVSAITFVAATVPQHIPVTSWLWFAGAVGFLVAAGWRTFADQTRRNQQELFQKAQASAILVQKEWRDFRQHVETLNRENERLNAEVRRFLDLRPKPNVVLVYEGTAQFAALKLINNGQMDATKVTVSPARIEQREMRFTGFARLRSGDEQTLDFDRFNLFAEGTLQRSEPDWSAGGRWRHGLVWLFGDFSQSATVTVTFYEDDGKMEHTRVFDIRMNSNWGVEVLPA